jgi:hypothetical protein
MNRRVPDTSKIRDLIGFTTRYKTDDILRECIEGMSK